MHVDGVLRAKGTDIVSVAPSATLQSAAALLQERQIGALLVLDQEGQLCGIVSERDLVSSIAQFGASALASTVSECMTSEVVTCTSTDTLEQLMAIMTERRIRHLPVVDNDRLVGVISIGDVVKRRLGEVSDEARALSDYITLGR